MSFFQTAEAWNIGTYKVKKQWLKTASNSCCKDVGFRSDASYARPTDGNSTER